MNLHGIVSGAIGMINPLIPISVQISTGSTTAASGKRAPSYANPVTLQGQVQPLSSKDLRQLDALNIQGSERAIYVNGILNGVVRFNQKGGDLITIVGGVNAGVWLVTTVLEQWPDWVKVAVTLQNGA